MQYRTEDTVYRHRCWTPPLVAINKTRLSKYNKRVFSYEIETYQGATLYWLGLEPNRPQLFTGADLEDMYDVRIR